MAWTTPRTWVDTEVVTATIMNTHVRDNELVLKTSIGNDGRFLGLSASTLADLSGLNLTGLAKLASGNTYTGGVHDFGGGANARLRIAVGTDKFGGAPGSKTPGSMWTEGNYLHHVASSGVEYRYLGEVVTAAPSAGLPGSVWAEGNFVHYVDENDNERRVTGTSSGFHSDAAARAGSAWIETYFHWIREGGTTEFQGHSDSHSDQGHTDTHSDPAHSDSHTDHHDDGGHTDGHGDGHDDQSHDDSHADSHSDQGHSDLHTDNFEPHDDVHEDVGHDDSHSDSHSDVGHNDQHNDTHNDNHSDGGHGDAHDDQHTDSHGDLGHQDSHGDAPELIGL